jgi:hypothetical protein
MPTEPGTVSRPKYPLSQLTTSELSRYRRELEHAIEDISPDAQVQADLRRSLDAVIAEQEDRARAAKAAVDA